MKLFSRISTILLVFITVWLLRHLWIVKEIVWNVFSGVFLKKLFNLSKRLSYLGQKTIDDVLVFSILFQKSKVLKYWQINTFLVSIEYLNWNILEIGNTASEKNHMIFIFFKTTPFWFIYLIISPSNRRN